MHKIDEPYYAEAFSWDVDRSVLLRDSHRIAWRVTAGAMVLSVGCVVTLLVLLPLKKIEPYLIRVDNTTGVVDVVPHYIGRTDLPETVTRYLVTQYVTERERYVAALAETDYMTVGAFHSAPMNQAWAALWTRTNADSPLNRYAQDAAVTVQVQAVSFLKRTSEGNDTLQVRFQTATQRAAGGAAELEHYVATLQTAFSAPSTDVRIRAANPLGFKVLEYRKEPELLPTDPTPVLHSQDARSTRVRS